MWIEGVHVYILNIEKRVFIKETPSPSHRFFCVKYARGYKLFIVNTTGWTLYHVV